MSRVRSSTTRLAATFAAGALLTGGGLTAATVLSSSQAATPAQAVVAAASTARRPAKRPVLARAEHASLELRRGGSWITLTYDRGTIAAVGNGSITLTHPDGTSVTLSLASSTKVRGDASTLDGLQRGQRALVVSEGGTAVLVAQHQRAPRHPTSAGTTSA